VVTSPQVTRGIKVVSRQKSLTVRGKATDDSGVYEVVVNGTEAVLSSSGAFSAEVLLAVGDNTIHVTATDTKRNVGEKMFTILRKPQLAMERVPPKIKHHRR